MASTQNARDSSHGASYNASRCTVAPDASEPIACAPYPSPGSPGNGPWVLCSTSAFPILQYIVVGGYSRLPDLYTATGSSRRENRPGGESERGRQRGREREERA